MRDFRLAKKQQFCALPKRLRSAIARSGPLLQLTADVLRLRFTRAQVARFMLTGEDIRDMHSDPAEKTFKLTTEPLMFFLLRFGSEFLVDVVLQKKAALARHYAGLAPPDEENGTADSGSYEVLSSSTTTRHVVSPDEFATHLLEITTALLREGEKASTLAAAASAAVHAGGACCP